jgi:predicted DNA-binding protein
MNIMNTESEKPVKKVTGVRLDPAIVKELKYLSVDLGRSVTNLLEEAAEDLLAKYKRRK